MKLKTLAALFVLSLIGSLALAQQKEIVFWHIQSAEPGLSLIKKEVDRFMAANPDVKVQVVPIQNDAYKTKNP